MTSKEDASGCRPAKSLAALFGPIVWLLDGPLPILYISLSDFMILVLTIDYLDFTALMAHF